MLPSSIIPARYRCGQGVQFAPEELQAKGQRARLKADDVYPGDRCRATGAGHSFFAHAWALTCECTGGGLASQENGSWCPWWGTGATKPCGKLPSCNLSMPNPTTCKNYTNLVPMLTLAGSDPGSRECRHDSGEGTNACGYPSANAATVAAARSMPVGHRTLRLYGPDRLDLCGHSGHQHLGPGREQGTDARRSRWLEP